MFISVMQAVCDAIVKCRARGVLYQHICILYRMRQIGKPFQRELARRKIPTNNTAPDLKSGPYKKAIAQDLLAYLRVAVNQNDAEAFKRSINRPNRGLGKQSLEKLVSASQRWGINLWVTAERCAKHGGAEISTAQRSGLSEYVRIIKNIQAMFSSKSPEDVIRSAYSIIFDGPSKSKSRHRIEEDASDIQSMLNEMVDDLEIFGCTNSEHFSSAQNPFDSTTARILSRFASIVSQSSSDIRKERELEVVTLTTVHQAKGLEFPIVFLVRFNEACFPISIKPVDGDDEESFEARRMESIQEERRLAYVAVSRAKVSLYISWVNGGKDGMTYSRFIDELPQECMQSQRDAEQACDMENSEHVPSLINNESPQPKRISGPGCTSGDSEQKSSPAANQLVLHGSMIDNLPETVNSSLHWQSSFHKIPLPSATARKMDEVSSQRPMSHLESSKHFTEFRKMYSFENRKGSDPALPVTEHPRQLDSRAHKAAFNGHYKSFVSACFEQQSNAATELARKANLNRKPAALAQMQVQFTISSADPAPSPPHESVQCSPNHEKRVNFHGCDQGLSLNKTDNSKSDNASHRESQEFWKDNMRRSVMQSLPTFLTSNIEQTTLKTMGKNDVSMKSVEPLSISCLRTLKPAVMGLPSVQEPSAHVLKSKMRKTPLPSFLLDPGDLSEEDVVCSKAPKLLRKPEPKETKTSPILNFSWGR
jgi:ATP-dependent exoDNAse (exonuclease V) beta subunit